MVLHRMDGHVESAAYKFEDDKLTFVLDNGITVAPAKTENGDWKYNFTPDVSENGVRFSLSQQNMDLIHQQLEKSGFSKVL